MVGNKVYLNLLFLTDGIFYYVSLFLRMSLLDGEVNSNGDEVCKVLIVLLLISGCATGSHKNTEPFDEETHLKENDKLIKELEGCQLYNVAKLDDGVSDALTIARAVNQNCVDIYMAYLQNHFNHPSSAHMVKFPEFTLTLEKWREEFIKNDAITLRYVLLNRGRKSK